MIMKHVFLLPALAGALLAGSGARANAQDAKLDRLEPRTRAAVIAIIDSAIEAGLPAKSLVSEAQRVAVFGQSSDVIIASVRSQARRLLVARRALGNAFTADVESGAAALKAGVDAVTLVQLRRARPDSSGAVALVVLADLVPRGVPADTASGLILAVAGLSPGDSVFHELRASVAQDISSGKTPLYAAETRTRGVLGASATNPAVVTEADTRGVPTTLGGSRPTSPPPPEP